MDENDILNPAKKLKDDGSAKNIGGGLTGLGESKQKRKFHELPTYKKVGIILLVLIALYIIASALVFYNGLSNTKKYFPLTDTEISAVKPIDMTFNVFKGMVALTYTSFDGFLELLPDSKRQAHKRFLVKTINAINDLQLKIHYSYYKAWAKLNKKSAIKQERWFKAVKGNKKIASRLSKIGVINPMTIVKINDKIYSINL